jgi:hypothetical protein
MLAACCSSAEQQQQQQQVLVDLGLCQGGLKGCRESTAAVHISSEHAGSSVELSAGKAM